MVLRSTIALLLTLSFLFGAQDTKPAGGEAFICPPCGAECHFTTYPKKGNCGVCGMGLVPLAAVPQLGVLLHTNVSLSSSLLTLSLLAASNAGRAFTVADTTEPLRIADALEVRPQFAFGEAPELDVLVVPDGYGAWDDSLLVEWVKTQAAGARFVLVVDSGSLVLGRAGLLAGERVPASQFVAQRGKELAPELVFDEATPWRQSGKFYLARDAEGAIEATLAMLHELAGEECARETAVGLGRAWKAAK